MAVSSRAVDYWTDDAVQQCFSALVRWYDVWKIRKKNIEEPSFGGGQNTRCRTCLDELSRTYSETSSRRVVCFLCEPVGTGLGAAYVKCG